MVEGACAVSPNRQEESTGTGQMVMTFVRTGQITGQMSDGNSLTDVLVLMV